MPKDEKTNRRKLLSKAEACEIHSLMDQIKSHCYRRIAGAEDVCQEACDVLQDAEAACSALLDDLQATKDAACGME